jgi:Family of unknown function (DUF6200)
MTSTRPPVVIRAGKAGRKQIKKLERGEGKLMNYVHEALEQVRTELGPEGQSVTLVPVVLIVRRKPKRSLLGLNF